MTHKLIPQKNVDIYEYPQPVSEIDDAVTELSIGDLHANAMYMMHFLVSNGVVTMSQEDYQQLQNIYTKNETTKKDIDAFNAIIDGLEINKKPLIRLIGDEICDRGKNDYFIFKILDKLKKSGIQTEIMLSNHGIEFLIPYEKNEALSAPYIGHHNQTTSMDNMRSLLDKGVISKKEVDALISESYLPNLKLISYSLDDGNITIFSHAGIGLETIQSLAAKFNDEDFDYQDSTAAELAQTIDQINHVFLKHVLNHTVHTLVPELTEFQGASCTNDPVTFLIWNRGYENLKREKVHNNYQMYFVHGHDSHESTHENIVNLDNRNFKPSEFSDSHQGSYVVVGGQGQSTKVNDLTTTKLFSTLYQELNTLKNKAESLKSNGHEAAYKSAINIHTTLMSAYQELQVDKNDSIANFNQTCTDVIAKERQVLDKHRGWSEFLTNLAIAIPTLGIGLLVKGAVNLTQNKSFFFVHKTNSGKIVDEIEEQLQQACSSQP